MIPGGARSRVQLAIVLGLAACKSEPQVDWDTRLSLAHAQVVGTHNSYHVSGDGDFGPWEYDHPPLQEQIDAGVRQFELDLHWSEDDWQVIHEPTYDPGTTCPWFGDCLAALAQGSDRNPDHLPILFLIEVKTGYDSSYAEERLLRIETLLKQELGERILDPVEVRGDSATLREAVAQGWPVLEGQRGRFLPVLHVRGGWAEDGRALGLEGLYYDAYGDLELDWAVFSSMNDPYDERIPDLVAQGHLVRTRTDSNTVEARANDTSRRDQAMASGAQFLSTDFPTPHPLSGYVVDLGSVARCNPISAPEDCAADRLE